MKLTLMLILGLCSFQGFETRSFVQLDKTRDITDDIMTMIKKIVQLIDDIVKTLQIIGDDYDDLIELLEGYANVIGTTAMELINDFDSKLDDAANYSDRAAQCVWRYRPDYFNWLQNFTYSLNICSDNISKDVTNFMTQSDAWGNDTAIFIRDVETNISSCTQKGKAEDILACLQDQYPVFAKRFADLDQTADNLIDTINTQSPIIINNYQQCCKGAIDTATDEETNIMNDVYRCTGN